MALLTYSVCFGEPGGDFLIDIVDVLEAKGMKMISRRERFDAAKARVLQATRQNNMALDPISADYKRREAHPNLKSDSGVFGQHGDR